MLLQAIGILAISAVIWPDRWLDIAYAPLLWSEYSQKCGKFYENPDILSSCRTMQSISCDLTTAAPYKQVGGKVLNSISGIGWYASRTETYLCQACAESYCCMHPIVAVIRRMPCKLLQGHYAVKGMNRPQSWRADRRHSQERPSSSAAWLWPLEMSGQRCPCQSHC